jgi:hypothetical protein
MIRNLIPIVLTAACVAITTTVAALFAPDTWVRPVVAMLVLWGAVIAFCCGLIIGRRR